MQPKKIEIKQSPIALIVTIIGWVMYPMAFAYFAPDQSTFYWFFVWHIVYCIWSSVVGFQLMRNTITSQSTTPHVINNQGQILFHGLEVWFNEFKDDKVEKTYGLLCYDKYQDVWYLRPANGIMSYKVEKPEELRYDPFQAETRYEDLGTASFTTNAKVVGQDGYPSNLNENEL